MFDVALIIIIIYLVIQAFEWMVPWNHYCHKCHRRMSKIEYRLFEGIHKNCDYL